MQEIKPPQPIDRLGKCPCCNAEWKDDDILIALKKLHVFREKTEEDLVSMAVHSFGYQVSNPRHFSRVIAVKIVADREMDRVETVQEVNDVDYYMCPDCRNVWNADTGEHFINLQTLKTKLNEPNSTELSNRTEVEATQGVAPIRPF